MKLSMDLASASSPAWLEAVLADFDSFLQDHANCERKASAMAMHFVAKYPDREKMIPELIETAIEELEHFQQVYQIMVERGVPLPHKIGPDPYAGQLMDLCRTNPRDRFLDRLVVASVVETRGAERFRLIADNLEDPELKKFYKMFWTSEAKHGHIFVKFALWYFEESEVYDRLGYFIEKEAEILAGLEIRSALH